MQKQQGPRRRRRARHTDGCQTTSEPLPARLAVSASAANANGACAASWPVTMTKSKERRLKTTITGIMMYHPVSLLLFLLTDSCIAFSPTRLQRKSRKRRQQSKLGLSTNANDSSSDIVYLGKGAEAIVRPGVVLIPPSYEFSTYLRESALFIYAMGYDERLETDVIRGVVIDYPSAFSVGEMAGIEGALSDNVIFRGGSEGGDSVMMLHSFGGTRDEIGTSRIYEGGLQEAMEACENGRANPEQFKFFFNYCNFNVQELEDILAVEEDGDAWVSVQVPNEMVLNWHWDRGECWKQLRNAVRQHVNTE